MSESSVSTELPEGLGRSLREKLARLRSKLVRVEVTRRLAVALCVALSGVAALLPVDWLIDLPMNVRVAALIGLGVAVGVLLLRALAAFVTQRRDEETLALMVEAKEPGFQSRLIATVQFARGKATVPDAGGRRLVERMVEDTESFARPLALTEAANTRPMKRALLVLLILVAIAAVGYLAGGTVTRDLLQRAFLADVPVPRETRVVWTSGDLKVGIGDPVTIEAEAAGYLPEEGSVRVRFASGEKARAPMAPRDDDPSRFVATLGNVQESFSYRVFINDGKSPRGEVRAFPRPRVEELAGEQTYPPYTRLPATTHQPGEFLLVPGSRLDLTITATQPLQRGTVRLLGTDVPATTSVDPENPRVLHASFRVANEELSGFTVDLLDREGMASRDATVYRIDVLSDKPPEVRIVRPSGQRALVTEQARVLVGYEAEDRFGIEGLALHYAVDGSDSVGRLALPLAKAGAKQVSEDFDWDLAAIDPPLRVGDEIEFWIEAYDENAETSAGVSAKRLLRVVTPREKRDDLLGRAGDSLARIDRATDDQERLNAALAEWIRSQAPSAEVEAPPPTDQDNEN